MTAATSMPAPRPLSLRVSVTDRCQLRCRYCMPREGVPHHAHADILRYEEIVALVRVLQKVAPVAKVRLTGGEPLVRPEIERLIGMLAGLHLPEIALTTNGQLLCRMAAPLKAAGLARVNVSLDSLNAQTYRELTHGGVLSKTIAGIDEALRCGLTPLKLNTVVLRGVNEAGILDLVAFAAERDVEIRFLEVMPIGTAAEHCREWFFSSDEVKAVIKTRYRLEPIPRTSGSTCRSFTVSDGAVAIGRAGFISACSDPFCGDCGRLRLTSDGRLIGCLAADIGIPVRALLADSHGGTKPLEDAISGILAHKKSRSAFCQPQIMAAIGG